VSGIEAADGESEARRGAAISALLHRVSGGLNNASMAFELALGAGGPPRADDRVLQAGLSGVHQAARAIALLSELLTPAPAVALNAPAAALSDVTDMLRVNATMRGVALHIDGEPARGEESSTTPALAVASLLEGLAANDQASSAMPAELAASRAHGELRLRSVTPAKDAA
jgi:hypothetical protein